MQNKNLKNHNQSQQSKYSNNHHNQSQQSNYSLESEFNLIKKIPDVYNLEQFTPQLIATEIIDTILTKGSEILYDHYLQSKVPQHAKNFLFSSMNFLLSSELKPYDHKPCPQKEILEQEIKKTAPDTKSSYSIPVEKRFIIIPDQASEMGDGTDGGPSPTKKYMQSTQKSFKSYKSYRSVRSIRSFSQQMPNKQQQQDEKKLKRKKLEPVDEINFIQLANPPLSEEQVDYKKVEDKLRSQFLVKLGERQKQEEQQRLQAQNAKMLEKATKKRLHEMNTKKYTYDYDGQLIFEKPQSKKDQNQYYQYRDIQLNYKFKQGNYGLSKHYDNVFQMEDFNHNNKRSKDLQEKSLETNSKGQNTLRQHSSTIHHTTTAIKTIHPLKPEPVQPLDTQEAQFRSKLMMSQNVPNQTSYEESMLPKTAEILHLERNNVSSIASNIKLNKGVTLTEYQRGIPYKITGDQDKQTKDGEPQKKRMKKSEYLAFIENNKYVPPGVYTRSRANTQQQDTQIWERSEVDSEINNRNSTVHADISLLDRLDINDHEKQKRNKQSEETLQFRLNQIHKNGYGNAIDLTQFEKNPLIIKEEEPQTPTKKQTSRNTSPRKKQSSYNGISENYYKDFVESPVKKKIQQEKLQLQLEQERQKQIVKQKRQQRALSHNVPSQQQQQMQNNNSKNNINKNELPTLMKRPPSSGMKRDIYKNIQKEKVKDQHNIKNQIKNLNSNPSNTNINSASKLQKQNSFSKLKRSMRGNSMYETGQKMQTKEQIQENKQSIIKIQKNTLVNFLVS